MLIENQVLTVGNLVANGEIAEELLRDAAEEMLFSASPFRIGDHYAVLPNLDELSESDRVTLVRIIFQATV